MSGFNFNVYAVKMKIIIVEYVKSLDVWTTERAELTIRFWLGGLNIWFDVAIIYL